MNHFILKSNINVQKSHSATDKIARLMVAVWKIVESNWYWI